MRLYGADVDRQLARATVSPQGLLCPKLTSFLRPDPVHQDAGGENDGPVVQRQAATRMGPRLLMDDMEQRTPSPHTPFVFTDDSKDQAQHYLGLFLPLEEASQGAWNAWQTLLPSSSKSITQLLWTTILRLPGL